MQNSANLRELGAHRSAPFPAPKSLRARYLKTPVWTESLRHALTVVWPGDLQDHLLGNQSVYFKDLDLSSELLRAVEKKGYREATPIQQQSIPLVLQGKDLLAGAQTGTGKTAGFTLPLLQQLFSRIMI